MGKKTSALLLLVAIGCSPKHPIQTGCSLNSDCHDPLVCAFGRCHAQCNANRDCLDGRTCIRSGSVGVCQLGDEAPCSPTRPCPGDLVCSAQGQCLSRCTGGSACLADQRCAEGVCQPNPPDGGGSDSAAPDLAPTSPDHAEGTFRSLLDTFDRPDGPLNSGGMTGWVDDDHRGLDTYVVSGNRLSGTVATAVPIWWGTPFGGEANVTEAFITIGSLSTDVTDFSLLLASQTLSFCDFVRVFYEVPTGLLKIVSCQDGVGTIYDTVSIGLIANQQLAARFDTGTGALAVFIAGKKIGDWKIDQWRYLHKPGRIGLWLHRNGTGGSGPDLFDDFGGG